MFCQAGFDQWLTTIMQHLSHLSKPQAMGLALWSFGMVLARSWALTAVRHMLATGMQRKEQTVRQQLREWYYDTPRKRGAKRHALPVETCFAPLRGWVASGWQGTPLALAIDATTWGQRLVVLAVSVVYRGAWAGIRFCGSMPGEVFGPLAPRRGGPSCASSPGLARAGAGRASPFPATRYLAPSSRGGKRDTRIPG